MPSLCPTGSFCIDKIKAIVSSNVTVKLVMNASSGLAPGLVCVTMDTCVHMWPLEDKLQCRSLLMFTVVFSRLAGLWASSDSLVSARITLCFWTQLLCGLWRSELSLWGLWSKGFTHRTISPPQVVFVLSNSPHTSNRYYLFFLPLETVIRMLPPPCTRWCICRSWFLFIYPLIRSFS